LFVTNLISLHSIMQNIKNHFWGLAISLLIFSGAVISIASRSKTVNKQEPPSKCLIVSDIHFNPMYGSSDTAIKGKLARSSFEEWKKYFESSAPQMTVNASLLYMDANYGVLQSAIANMKKRLPHPAFIVIAGDFIWHGAKPADSVLKRKSIQFIARLFKESFPGTTIIPAMGNNDTYGADYALQDSRFLNDFADAWEPALPKSSGDSLKAQGYYTCTKGDLKLIVINSALLNNGTRYPQALLMLRWLHSTLSNPNSKNVWIVMHIPPGLNVYSGASFWNAGATKAFINDVVTYSSKVKLTIASHTHFNDFRVFYNADKTPVPVAFMRIVPSICSNHGNNPSFEVAEFNGTTGSIIHETNYYLDLAAVPKGKAPGPLDWNDMLSSSSTLKLGKIDAQGFSKFMDNVKADQSWQSLTNYTRFYTVGTKVDSSIRVSRSNYMKYLKADSLKQ
jgi:sphingomyelin phosphodiesterase acid-like 3